MRTTGLSKPGLIVAWAVMFIAVGASMTFGQNTGSISGTVVGEEGEPLPGATLKLLNIETGREWAIVTDGDGAYKLAALPGGDYRLSASMPGHIVVRQSLLLAAGEEQTLDFTLPKGAINEKLTVTALKGERTIEEIPQVVTVVDAAEIQERRPAAVQEAMDGTPNMLAIEANPYRARPNYRGLSSSRVLVVIDGERMNNSRVDVNATGLSPAMVDISQLKAIEVVGGAGSSLYGTDAISGTINLVTLPPSRPPEGSLLDMEMDLVYNTNARHKKASLIANYATPKFAFRGIFSQFDWNEPDTGDESVSRSEVLNAGEVYTLLGGAPNQFSVYDLPGETEIVDSRAEGFNAQADLWFFPDDKQSVRVKLMTSQHDDLGWAFSSPPYNPRQRISPYRDLNKVRVMYERVDLADWIPRFKFSAYRQKFKRPQNDIQYNIDQGSSWDVDTSGIQFYTGDTSSYTTGGSDTNTVNEIESVGAEAAFNIKPFPKALLTTGFQYMKDESRDRFDRFIFDGQGNASDFVSGKTTPDVDFENFAWFGQLEWKPTEWLQISAGTRWDNWEVTALGTQDYPVPGSNVIALYELALGAPAAVQAMEDVGFQLEGVLDYVADVQSGASFTSDRDSWTSNVGAVFNLPGGFHPYLRWGQSYREPEVTVRFLMRNFSPSPAFFGVPGLPNVNLEPEEGESIDVGLRYNKGRARFSVGYFENEVTNFITTALTGVILYPGDAGRGVIPTIDLDGDGTAETAAGVFFQRVNRGRVEFQGIEASADYAFTLGERGSLTPSITLSWMEGQDLEPTADAINDIDNYYNTSLPGGYRFEGSTDDVPFGEVTPLAGLFNLRYTDAQGQWFLEYEYAFADEIERVNPGFLSQSNGNTAFGHFKSLDGYDKHSIRAGFSLGDRSPVRFTVGLENLTDELIFLPYQLGPQPGRALVIGMNLKLDRIEM